MDGKGKTAVVEKLATEVLELATGIAVESSINDLELIQPETEI